jgi:hypothetical protein
VDDPFLADVEALIGVGVAATRADAVRLGSEALVERHRRHQTGQAIVGAYRQPRQMTKNWQASIKPLTR